MEVVQPIAVDVISPHNRCGSSRSRQRTGSGGMGWGNLPRDVLGVLGVCLGFENLRAARLVCRHWKAYLASNLSDVDPLREVDVCGDLQEWSQRITALRAVAPRLEQCMLYVSSRISATVLAQRLDLLAASWSRLSKLEIRFLTPLNPMLGEYHCQLCSAISKLTSLRTLYVVMGALPTIEDMQVLPRLPALQDLKLISGNMQYGGLTEDHFEVLSQAASLEMLEVEVNDMQLSSTGLCKLTRLSNLSALTLHGELTDDFIPALKYVVRHLTSLMDLKIQVTTWHPIHDLCADIAIRHSERPRIHASMACAAGFPGMSPDEVSLLHPNMPLLGQLATLKPTCLRSLHLYDAPVEHASVLQALAALPGLEELSLDGIASSSPQANISETDLLLLSSLHNLRSISWETPSKWRSCMTPELMMALATSWKKLKCLRLLHAPCLDTGVLCSQFSALQTLALHFQNPLDTQSELAPSLNVYCLPKTLTELNLSAMNLEFDASVLGQMTAVAPLVQAPLPHLEDLILASCRMLVAVDDPVAREDVNFFSSLTALRSLEVRNVSHFGSEHIRAISTLPSMTALRVLDLDCPVSTQASTLSNQCLVYLSSLRHLRYLSWVTMDMFLSPLDADVLDCVSKLATLYVFKGHPHPDTAAALAGQLARLPYCDMEAPVTGLEEGLAL